MRRGAPWGLVTAAVGVAVWVIVDPRTPDLAGQVYRANLFREAGFLVYDTRWYGGHDVPGYCREVPADCTNRRRAAYALFRRLGKAFQRGYEEHSRYIYNITVLRT